MFEGRATLGSKFQGLRAYSPRYVDRTMELRNIILRSPYTPYSIYLRGLKGFGFQSEARLEVHPCKNLSNYLEVQGTYWRNLYNPSTR